MQVGLDDVLHAWFQQSSIQAGEACLDTGVIPQCRAALQTGAAPALRPGLWANALALELPQVSIEAHFQDLCSKVEGCHLLTDLLVSLFHVVCCQACSCCWRFAHSSDQKRCMTYTWPSVQCVAAAQRLPALLPEQPDFPVKTPTGKRVTVNFVIVKAVQL